MEGRHVASLGSDLCVHVCVCVCVSLEHYSQMFGRLSYGLLISKRSQDKKQLVFFFLIFKAVTIHSKTMRTVW